MRTIEKIYDAASRNKLTITANKAVIRFKQGATADECNRIEKFLTRIINKVPFNTTTIRGHLAHHKLSDTFYIVLRNESKTYSERFFENEGE